MSDDKKNQEFRRFGRRDQKDRLTKPKSLFPDEETDDSQPSDPSPEAPAPKAMADLDFEKLSLPDTDSEALAILSSLSDEVRAPVITPQEDRYPPIAPTAHPQSPSASATTLETAPQQHRWRNRFYNLLSLLLVIGTILNVIWFAIIWDNPQSALNPLPPATPFVVVTVPADESMSLADQPTPDADGQIFVVITETPQASPIPTESLFPFIAEPVIYTENTNDLGCNWWSIGGTVVDLDDEPITGYRIRVSNDTLDEVVFSGASQSFGDGGYELPLVGTPREETFEVQLFTGQDVPLSEEITITTQADCESNVAVINFVQNR